MPQKNFANFLCNVTFEAKSPYFHYFRDWQAEVEGCNNNKVGTIRECCVLMDLCRCFDSSQSRNAVALKQNSCCGRKKTPKKANDCHSGRLMVKMCPNDHCLCISNSFMTFTNRRHLFLRRRRPSARGCELWGAHRKAASTARWSAPGPVITSVRVARTLTRATVVVCTPITSISQDYLSTLEGGGGGQGGEARASSSSKSASLISVSWDHICCWKSGTLPAHTRQSKNSCRKEASWHTRSDGNWVERAARQRSAKLSSEGSMGSCCCDEWICRSIVRYWFHSLLGCWLSWRLIV